MSSEIGMGREEVLSIVRKQIIAISGKSEEDILESSSLMDDVDLSSVEIMALVSDFEDSFNIIIKSEELTDVVSFGDLVDFICTKIR